ncbi:hypothetical protein JCM6882_005245 [Rhodosporidiobolus microsporus]
MDSVDAATPALAELMRQQAAEFRNDASAVPLNVDEALAYGENLRGKVVVVTGAASGFGKQYALVAARNGAKLVLSDLRKDAVLEVVDEIKAAGGEATGVQCNVVDWDAQVKMFRHGVNTYGHIDVVVANAGIAEGGSTLMDLRAGEDGEPSKPKSLTIDINVVGLSYTVKLAFFHLRNNLNREGKNIVILGSMASYFGLPGAPCYSTSKHAVLGLMRSLYYDAGVHGIGINIVNPFFVKTNIFGAVPLLLLAGIPLATVDEVVAGMVAASGKPKTSGSSFVVDFKGILEVPYAEHQKGTYYQVFMARSVGLISFAKWLIDSVAAIKVGIQRRSLA